MLIHFTYCRKSSEDEERQIISNESQEEELALISNRDGLRIGDTIREEASAKASGTRPRFNDMVKRIKKGEANAILCWHVNRLSRNAGDAAMLVELMDQGKLLEIRTPSQTFKNTPADKFLIILFCGQAKLENDNKGVDVERGMRKKATMGWHPGVAPMGYLNDKTKNRGERDIYNDPDRFHLVKQMWNLMLTGTYTPSQILKLANDEWGFRTRRTRKQGGRPLSLNCLYHIFHRPFYYGWYEYPVRSGKWYAGKHEPMITKEEFDKVQAILGRKGNPRAIKHLTFSYTGMLRCGACPGMITAEEKHMVRCSECRTKFASRHRDKCPKCETPITKMKRPRFFHYTYYHCARRKAKCIQSSIQVTHLEQQIQKRLGRIKISAAFKSAAFQWLKEVYRDDIDTAGNVNQSRDKAYNSCVEQLENLVKLKTSPANADGSLLSDEEYSKQRRDLLKEKTALGSPENVKQKADEALRQSEEAFEFAQTAISLFADGDFRAKKQVLTTVGSKLTLMDKNLIFEAKRPYQLIETFKDADGSIMERIETKKNRAKYERNGKTIWASSCRLRDVKDVRNSERKIKKLASKVYHFFRSPEKYTCRDCPENRLSHQASLN